MDIEQAIQDAGANVAPRVTPSDVEHNIASEHYFTAQEGAVGAALAAGAGVSDHSGNPLHLLTFCVLVLKNGFTVTGESACASPENFNAEIGRQIARSNAVSKVWPLLGFRLRDQLHAAPMQRVAPAGYAHYVGTKEVFATPMTRAAYIEYRGWELPANENGGDAGWLVEYVDGGRANDSRHVGYISWSPDDVFTRAYKAV